MKKLFNKNIEIFTDRLILRFISKNDTKAIYENIYSDKEVLMYFIAKNCSSLEEAKEALNKTVDYYLSKEQYCLAIELKSTHEVIGWILECGLSENSEEVTEVGYAIGKKYWNKGYTTEALKAFINLLFDIGVKRVEASYMLENISSKRVMEKCNMKPYEIRKHDIFYRDIWWDLEYYYIEKDEK